MTSSFYIIWVGGSGLLLQVLILINRNLTTQKHLTSPDATVEFPNEQYCWLTPNPHSPLSFQTKVSKKRFFNCGQSLSSVSGPDFGQTKLRIWSLKNNLNLDLIGHSTHHGRKQNRLLHDTVYVTKRIFRHHETLLS